MTNSPYSPTPAEIDEFDTLLSSEDCNVASADESTLETMSHRWTVAAYTERHGIGIDDFDESENIDYSGE